MEHMVFRMLQTFVLETLLKIYGRVYHDVQNRISTLVYEIVQIIL